jgi:hypothetical protein
MMKALKVRFAPAGKYFIGDPCYGVPDEKWSDVLDNTGFLGLYEEGSSNRLEKCDQAGIWQVDGAYVLAAPTAYGDGSYPGSDGFDYGVDAGMLGAVQLDWALEGNTIERLKQLGTIVEFKTPVGIYYKEGTVEISSDDKCITIETGDDYDYEEDDGQPSEWQEWHDYDPDC